MQAGPEFGRLQGKVLVVKKALYGLKSSGAAFRAHLPEILDNIGFRSSMADPDVWMRPASKPSGEKYYKYILCYINDILCISHDAYRPMEEIKRTLKFKNDKIVEPDFYLGATIKKKVLNGQSVWTMSSQEYVKNAIKTVQDQLKGQGMKLPACATTPMSAGYYPEMDSSPELDQEDTTLFQELIGILCWAVEIGRVDILMELSMLSTYQALPREGYLEQIYHIFALLETFCLHFEHTCRLDHLEYECAHSDAGHGGLHHLQ